MTTNIAYGWQRPRVNKQLIAFWVLSRKDGVRGCWMAASSRVKTLYAA